MKNANLESSIIRAVWSSVDALNQQMLSQLSDRDLIQQIIKQVDGGMILNSQDRQSLVEYISSKVMLIRDLADF